MNTHHAIYCVFFLFALESIAGHPENISSLITQGEMLEREHPDSAIEMYTAAYQLALDQDSVGLAALAKYYTGLTYMQLGDFTNSRLALEEAEKRYASVDNRGQHCKVLVAIANGYNFETKYEQALVAYQNALDAAEKISDPLTQARILSNQSSIFNVTHRIGAALECLRRAEVLAKPLGNTAILGDIYNNFSTNYQALFQYDSAATYARQAALIYDNVNDDLYQALALTNLSAYLHEKDPPDLEESKGALDRSRSILDTIEASNIEINYWKHLAYYHFKKDNLSASKQASQTCLQLIKLFPDLPSERNIYEFLYKIFKKEGNIDSALIYHEKFTVVRDSLIFAESHDQLQELQARYESTKKDQEITEQNLVINKRTSQRNLLISVLILIALLTWFLLYRNRIKNKLQTEKIDNLQRQQKILVMDSMLQGQEEERKRIAQDLHDGLGTLLAAARMQMQNVQRELDKLGNLRLVDKTEKLIDHACKEVRRISHDMMPSALADLGLVAAIEDLVDDIRLQQELIFHLDLPEENVDVDNGTALHIYRIIQEILQNIVKHAQANIVELTLTKSLDGFHLQIADDGVGFRPEEIKQGLGLSSLRSRVSYLNGSINLDTDRGSGCEYRIMIPHQNANAIS